MILTLVTLLASKACADFTSGENDYWVDKSAEFRLGLLGTLTDGGHHSRHHQERRGGSKEHLPRSFEAGRDKWKNCASTIAYIKDQAACGSCWATAASEVIADRTCIACGLCKGAGGKVKGPGDEDPPCIDFSIEDIMTCCKVCGHGFCAGGYPIDAMEYWETEGVVTGAWFHSRCGCQPYQVDPTDDHIHLTPQCKKECQSGFPRNFTQDKHKGKGHRTVVGEAAMMNEIYEHGPIECAFSVYPNFWSYKSGVYDHTVGVSDGGHAVKVVGWGEESGTKYWLINNSWNTTWGMDGRFKFLRSGDGDAYGEKGLCGMQGACVAADPVCDHHEPQTLTCLP